MIILGIIVGLILLITIYFIQPYSALKSDFTQNVNAAATKMPIEASQFTAEDIAGLPEPVQKYFTDCGYIGTPKMSYMKATFQNVAFSTGPNNRTLKIDYTQYNFVKEPTRFAFIDSAMFGIPFQGFDCYFGGAGNMKGVLAKTFTLFDQKGAEMDQASLVTVLSECLLIPNVALQDYITWESIDETHAKAIISYLGNRASGLFTFAENGEMRSFTTDDRTAIDFNGNKQHVKWTAICDDYKDHNGIKQPSTLKAVWHYPEGDHTYFDGSNVKIEFYQ